MSDKLQLAIQATRAGDTKNAQFLLTQSIQEDPANPQSWYLLGLLVDDKAKKQVYLNKVLDLDPNHEKASQQLSALTETAVSMPDLTFEEESMFEDSALETEAVALSSDSPDLVAQDAGQTLPDWMADDLLPTQDRPVDVFDEVAVATEEPVPDWLEGSLDEDWDTADTEDSKIIITAPTDSESNESEKVEKAKEVALIETKPDKETSERNLNFLLFGLVILALIVFFILAYMIYTTI